MQRFSPRAMGRAIRDFFIPTVYAPTDLPGRPGGAPLTPPPMDFNRLIDIGVQRAGDIWRGATQRIREGIQRPGGWWGPEAAAEDLARLTGAIGLAATRLIGGKEPAFHPGGRVTPGYITPPAEAVAQPGAALPEVRFPPVALVRALEGARKREAIPAPSQPVMPAPAPVPAVRPPTPVERPIPTPAPAPTPAAPVARAPIMTPAAAPTPAPLPPAPVLPGGGVGIGPGRAIPTPAALPPTPVMPGELFQPRQPVGQPVGQFEAMIRALQGREAGRFVPMPLAGAAPFGPGPAAERMLRRLRERELGRILGGIPANI